MKDAIFHGDFVAVEQLQNLILVIFYPYNPPPGANTNLEGLRQ